MRGGGGPIASGTSGYRLLPDGLLLRGRFELKVPRHSFTRELLPWFFYRVVYKRVSGNAQAAMKSPGISDGSFNFLGASKTPRKVCVTGCIISFRTRTAGEPEPSIRGERTSRKKTIQGKRSRNIPNFPSCRLTSSRRTTEKMKKEGASDVEKIAKEPRISYR